MELVNGGDLLEFIHKRERLGTVMLTLPPPLAEGLRLDEITVQNMTRLLCEALEVRLMLKRASHGPEPSGKSSTRIEWA
jgi:hypothetical protein